MFNFQVGVFSGEQNSGNNNNLNLIWKFLNAKFSRKNKKFFKDS